MEVQNLKNESLLFISFSLSTQINVDAHQLQLIWRYLSRTLSTDLRTLACIPRTILQFAGHRGALMCADHQGVGATFRHFSWALWMPCSGEYEPAAGLSMFPGYCALCFFPPSPLSVRNVSTPTLVCVVPPKFLYLWILKNLGSVGQALVYKAILRIMEFILSKSWLSRLYFSSPFQWSVYERAHVG